MTFLPGKWPKMKRRRKEKSGKIAPSQKSSHESMISSQNATSKALPDDSPVLPEETPARSTSPATVSERQPSPCTRTLTTASVEEGYVKVSQEPRRLQRLISGVCPSPQTTMDQDLDYNYPDSEDERLSTLKSRGLQVRTHSRNSFTTECSGRQPEQPARNDSGSEAAKQIASHQFTDLQPDPIAEESPGANTVTIEEQTEPPNHHSHGLLGNIHEWDKLRALRKEALALRAILKKQRSVTQTTRESTERADSDYLKYVRDFPPINPAPSLEWDKKALEELYEKLQRARNEHGPAMEEFMRKQEALDVVEFEMGRIENHLYVLLFGNIPEETNISSTFFPKSAGIDSPSNPSPWLGLVAGVQERFQPLQTEYLSRLGDLDLARERLGILAQEKENFLAEQESLFRVGRDLSEDSKAALRDLPDQETELQIEIVKIQSDVERLRQECEEAGIELDGASDNGSGEPLSFYGDDVEQNIEPVFGGNTEPPTPPVSDL